MFFFHKGSWSWSWSWSSAAAVLRHRPPHIGPESTASSICYGKMGATSEEEERAHSFLAASVETVEHLLNYRFRDPHLLAESLTHSSYASNRSNYQRLEFLGDAALGLAFSNHLFLTNPYSPPSRLSSLRAANVSTEKLARVAVRHGLYPLLLRDAPELDVAVRDFTLAVLQSSRDVPGHAAFGGPHARAPKVLADLVEAVAGAVYVDCNLHLEEFWVVFRGFLEPIITVQELDEQPVARLYEICQKRGKAVSFQINVVGSDYVAEVCVDGKVAGVGSSVQKSVARMNAARDALPWLLDGDNTWAKEEEDGNREIEIDEKEGKRKLNEFCSKNHWAKPEYSVEIEKGPANEQMFKCSVSVINNRGKFTTSGMMKSRVKEAENNAAFKLLKLLEP